mmetsp:Transcript_79246/g.204138  ORF Transcript_79246/g.204138 Transcript_79246/m.204138 type:complete len:212 (+) Transcript_79246:1155-1790(+)
MRTRTSLHLGRSWRSCRSTRTSVWRCCWGTGCLAWAMSWPRSAPRCPSTSRSPSTRLPATCPGTSRRSTRGLTSTPTSLCWAWCIRSTRACTTCRARARLWGSASGRACTRPSCARFGTPPSSCVSCSATPRSCPWPRATRAGWSPRASTRPPAWRGSATTWRCRTGDHTTGSGGPSSSCCPWPCRSSACTAISGKSGSRGTRWAPCTKAP